MKITHFYYFILVVSVSTAFACSHKKPIIIPLPMASKIDTIMDRGKQIVTKVDGYIVQNYRDDEKTNRYIESFVANNKSVNFSTYAQYYIMIYKESEKTNIKNLENNPRDLDRYSQENDWIYKYSWNSGVFLSRWKLKNGEIIEPKSDIKVEDIPDSTK